MIIPGADRLEKEVGSKYALVILAAKRARFLKEGMQPLVLSSSANPLTVALEEILESKVRPAAPTEPAKQPIFHSTPEPEAGPPELTE